MPRSVRPLIAAVVGIFTSLTAGIALVPRVRLVEVIQLFFGAFAAGAGLTAALVQYKKARSGRGGAVVLFLVVAFSASVAAQTAPAGAPADLDAHVARTMQTFSVSGVSLGVVKDARVVVAKGYGVQKLGESTPVDAQTLFGIASNTKVVTAAALGLLVEEGKLDWDAPVIRYLPWFQMWDPYASRKRPGAS